MTTINLSVSFESLVTAIQSLTWNEQKKLLEFLEDQIFESEEAWENSPEMVAEIQQARQAYQAGDYQTLEEFMSNEPQNEP
jgi:Zn-dependent M16 (insulinase) family peptidase